MAVNAQITANGLQIDISYSLPADDKIAAGGVILDLVSTTPTERRITTIGLMLDLTPNGLGPKASYGPIWQVLW